MKQLIKRLRLPASFSVICLTLISCVWPEPGPGDPVPEIQASTEWSASSDGITVTIEASDLHESSVRLFPRGLGGGWMELDTSPPFAFSLDASGFTPGQHKMWVIADDGATYVGDEIVVDIYGCNGEHHLCQRRYNDVRYATTHNAMSNSTNGWIGPNQHLDVPAQLAAGVRALMLDTYRAGDSNFLGTIQVPDADGVNVAFLCHSVCALGNQPLAQGLREIREFLDEHPGAIITLILESYLSHELTARSFDNANLAHYAYTHSGDEWPTLGQLIDSGKRLVVLQDRAVEAEYPWLMNVWDHAFETHFSNAVPEDFSCTDNRGSPGADLFILNHFLTGIFGAPELAEQVNYNPLLIERIRECESFHGSMANFITVDFVSIGDTLATIKTLNATGGF